LLNLAQEVTDPLMDISMFLPEPRQGLKQLIPLLLNSLSFHGIQVHPLGQNRELLLGLIGMPMSIRLPNSKAGHLLAGRSKLGHLLMSNIEHSVIHPHSYTSSARRSQATFWPWRN
jgi:hypothetical protein